MNFREMDIKHSYISKGDNNIADSFLNPILSCAKEYKRSVGFFSSGVFRAIMPGIMRLARNKGSIKLIASPRLSIDDANAISLGYEQRQKYIIDSFSEDFEREIEELEQLLATKLNVIERQNKLKNMEQEVNQLDSYLSVDINEKEITRIYKEIKEIEQQIIETNVLIERKTNERRSKNGELMSATSLFNKKVEKYLKKMELNDDSDRIIKYAHMADTILEEYKIRLQKNKISVVALTMTECYKKLANKKTLINRISMDPITLDLYYEDYNGIEINKASLSAGEKQLMVISLLWALALCSKKKLPVIIDTPLSRLDSAHREALITTYFPQASEQTIILSTDSEIDRNYHDMMKNNIGDEFTLIYDDDSKSTTIQRGYFGEGDA